MVMGKYERDAGVGTNPDPVGSSCIFLSLNVWTKLVAASSGNPVYFFHRSFKGRTDHYPAALLYTHSFAGFASEGKNSCPDKIDKNDC